MSEKSTRPINVRVPSAYHDPREVVLKHIVAQAYWGIMDILRRNGVAAEGFDEIRFSFVKSFNSHHDLDLLCPRADEAAAALIAELKAQGKARTAAAVEAEVTRAGDASREALKHLKTLRHVHREQSYITDGGITIAGQPADEFAANHDYIRATLQLVDEDSAEVAGRALSAWQQGFVLGHDLLELLRDSRERHCSASEMLVDVLVQEQRSGTYPSMSEYEFRDGRTYAQNQRAKIRAIEEGYFLFGRLSSCVSLLATAGAPIDAREIDEVCPVDALFRQAGVVLTQAQLREFRKLMLIRCTHGLNPGEFVARIAGSVRTTLPQSLLAGLLVRSGKVHAGALTECMRQIEAWHASSSQHDFVEEILETGRFFGFGHRIHKRPSSADEDVLGGDPRTAFLIQGARVAFPDKEAEISAFLELARIVRRVKPTLAPNTDFGAAVWFRCLKFAPEVAEGFFAASRLPGMIAQVINELGYKANSLRPPLPVSLPYSV